MAMRSQRRERRDRDDMSDRGMLRKRPRHIQPDQKVDYKDAELLRKFMTERGKIIPARFSGLSAKQQRDVKRAIRRARVMGLVP